MMHKIGGEVFCDNISGDATKFRLELPRVSKRMLSDEKSTIVDDEPYNIAWIADFVSYLKGFPTIVDNEEDACNYLSENPDCILLIVDIRIGKTRMTSRTMTMQDANPEWAGYL